MNMRFTIIFVFCIFCSSFSFAESDRDYTNKKLKDVYAKFKEISEQVEYVNVLLNQQFNRASKTNDEISKIQSSIANIQQKLEEVEKKVDSNIKDTGNIAGTTKKHTVLTLIILIPIAIIVIAFLIYLFYPSQAKKEMDSAIASTIKNNVSQSKCPMCGWEHAPDETVCKNCGTKF